VATGQQLWTSTITEKPFYSAAFTPDGRRIVTGHKHAVRVWEAATGELVWSFRAHEESVYSVAFSPDGRRMLTSSGDRTFKLWPAAPLD